MADKINTVSSDNVPDLAHFIRSMQRIEGNQDCFGNAKGQCDQADCCWRLYCLESPFDLGVDTLISQ